MRTIFLFLFIMILSFSGSSQHKLEGTIDGHPEGNVTLLEYFGDKHSFIDSTRTDANGRFSFTLKEGTPSGLYSVAIGRTPLFNIIYNQEDISLKFNLSQYSLPEFIFSIENLIYYDYLVNAEKYDHKSGLITDILQYYPDNDSFYIYTRDHFFELQKAHREYTNRIIDEYPDKLVSSIIRSDRPAMIPEGFNWEELRAFHQNHFFDEIDFTDTILINTNILTGKCIDYLSFYSVDQSNKEIQEMFFIQAVDTILHKAMDNGKVFDFVMQYLIEGFDMYGFDRVISHIAENYEPANSCVNEDRKSELQKRVENLRKLAVGNTAPDIIIDKKGGGQFKLSELENDYVVVMFWASWCPHCNSMMPEINKLYSTENFPDFEVLAISLDTNANDFASALVSHTMPWINHCELKGWESKAAVDYSIYATPTMFLLDRNRKIIARPVSAYDLKVELNKLSER